MHQGRRGIFCQRLSFLFAAKSLGVFAMGALAPLEWGTRDLSNDYFLRAQSQNIDIRSPSGINFRPQCLKNAGVDLIILDAGHDDSPDSQRSEALPYQGASAPQELRPKVHEGHLNMVTAWMVYDMILKDSHLSDLERRELQTMLRLTRHPGEKSFGEFEKDFGYSNSIEGPINPGVDYRKEHTNYMMAHHRAFDPHSENFLSDLTEDVTSRSVMVSIHGNATDGYYNDIDLAWVITPQNIPNTDPSYLLGQTVAQGLSLAMPGFFQIYPGDNFVISQLKSAVFGTYDLGKIYVQAHQKDLRMLSTGLGNPHTNKILVEGFMMTGKAGDLVQRELTNDSIPQKGLSFYRGGSHLVASYDVSDLYYRYAQSIVIGLSRSYGCH